MGWRVRGCIAALFASFTQVAAQAGCSSASATSIQLADGIWMCGNSATTGSWESVWSMCNEANNFYLPTISSLSLRMDQSDASTWIATESWNLAVTRARREGFEYAVTGQPGGGYSGGGWNSVTNIDAGESSTLAIARILFARNIVDEQWLAMTDGFEDTDMVRGDSGFSDSVRPASEYAQEGHYWMSICLDASDFEGAYVWHHTWRKTVCTSGLSILHSDVTCAGNLGAECEYECQPEETCSGPYGCSDVDLSDPDEAASRAACVNAVGTQTSETGETTNYLLGCEYKVDEFHVYGSPPNVGSENYPVNLEKDSDGCLYQGVTVDSNGNPTADWSGCKHKCVYDESGTYGAFQGGKCVPNQCTPDQLPHSPTICGVNGQAEHPLQVCDYQCDAGYEAVGTHTCGLDGRFYGGSCVAVQCTSGLTIDNSNTVCAGTTGDVCEYQCEDGYIPGGVHQCLPSRRFFGGYCTAPLSCDGIEWGPKRNDTCGVCGGDNSTCAGCDGKVYSGATWDSCGVCGGNFVPSVEIEMGSLGSNEIGLRSSQDISIPTSAFWNASCSSHAGFSFRWSLADGDMHSCIGSNRDTCLDSRSAASPTLRIPPGSLKAGTQITIRVEVTAVVQTECDLVDFASTGTWSPECLAQSGEAVYNPTSTASRFGIRSVQRNPAAIEPPAAVCIENPDVCPRDLVTISDQASAEIIINCLREPVQAVISGGNRMVPRVGEITLDASNCVDPENDPNPFTYMWNCTKTGTEEDCPGMQWSWGEGTMSTIHPPNAPILTVTADRLEASTSYDFFVTVTKVSSDGTSRNDTTSVTITVAAGIVPSVNINQRDIRPKYNANERLVIQGLVSSNKDARAEATLRGELSAISRVQASLEARAQSSGVPAAAIAACTQLYTSMGRSEGFPCFQNEIIATGSHLVDGGEPITLLWQGFVPNATHQYAANLDLTAEGFLSTSIDAVNLVVTEFKLTPGQSYRFRLTGTGTDGDATAEVSITMNLSPVDGICRARCRTIDCNSLRDGMAIRDRFTLSAPDWVDEDDGPLWYRFGYMAMVTGGEEERQFFVTDFSMSDEVEAIIPAGSPDTLPEYRVTATCDVRDLYGGTASDVDSVTVRPYEVAADSSIAEAAEGMLSEAASSGDTQQSFQLVDAFSSTLNDGGRRRRYRRRMTEEEVSDDAVAARDLLVGTLGTITEQGAAVGAAGRIASSLNQVSAAPEEISSTATDGALGTVTAFADAGSCANADGVNQADASTRSECEAVGGNVWTDDKFDSQAVDGFANSASNLLIAAKGQFVEARRRRRLAEVEEGDGEGANVTDTSAEEFAAAAARGGAIRNIVGAVAVGTTGDKVAGEARTEIATDAFALETSREEAADMEGKTLGAGVSVPGGFLPEGFEGTVDSQVTAWQGDDNPFFFAGETNQSNASLASEVQSVSFNSADGAEIPVNGLEDPFIVNISVPQGIWCPINSTKEFLSADEACYTDPVPESCSGLCGGDWTLIPAIEGDPVQGESVRKPRRRSVPADWRPLVYPPRFENGAPMENGELAEFDACLEDCLINIAYPFGINGLHSYREEFKCSFFDDATQSFVIDGVELNRSNFSLTCAFYHLTDLSAVAGPPPQINKMDFDRLFSADFLMNNPVGFALAVGLLALLIYAFWWSIKEYIKESNLEGVTVNNAAMMQTEFALNQCNYKVDKISFTQRVIVKIRMDWDWGGLFFPMPGDPNSRSQRALVLLAATLFTLLFEIIFFKDPEGCISFVEGEGKQEVTYQYDCLSGSLDPSLTAEEAQEICGNQHTGRLAEVCDPICPQFVANGYMAALMAALCSIPFSKSMGYAFGWLQEPYSAVIEGDDASPPGRLSRCWNRITKGRQFKKEINIMDNFPADRTISDLDCLCTLMKQQELFEGVESLRDRREIARVLRYKSAKAHTILWEQGDMGKEVHSILRGQVIVEIKQADGELREAGIIGEGEYYGEKAFQNDNLRTAGIKTAAEGVELLVITGEDLIDGGHEDVLDRLVASLSGEVEETGKVSKHAEAASRWRSASSKVGIGALLDKASKDAAAKAAAGPTFAEKTANAGRALRSKTLGTMMDLLGDAEEVEESESQRGTPVPGIEDRKSFLQDELSGKKKKKKDPRPDDVETSEMAIDPNDLLMSATSFMDSFRSARPDSSKSPSRPSSAWEDPGEVRGAERTTPSPGEYDTPPREETARTKWSKVADVVLMDPEDELGAGPKPPDGAPPSTGRRRRKPANPWANLIQDVKSANSTGAIDFNSTSASALGKTQRSTLALRQEGSGKEVDPSAGGDGKDEGVKPHRKLVVVGAQGLRNADRMVGMSDPYATIHWNGCRVGQTKIVKNSLNPRWKAEFELPDVEDQDETELKITIWDHDFDRDDFLGQAIYMVKSGEKEGEERETFPIQQLPLKNHELKKSKKVKKSKQATGEVAIELKEGTDTRPRIVRRRRTPLHDAACRGEHKKLVFLINEAGWMDAVDDKDPERGWTALHFAVYKGYKNCVRVLLQFAANVDIADDYGWTPLMEASWSGRCKSVLWMLGAGAKADVQDKDGWTALHAAAHQGNFGCATALIDSGADRIVPDNSGQNAAMVAEGRKYNALGHLIMFGTQDARRRKPVHAGLVFFYAFAMGLACVLVIAATTAAFTMERTIKWLTATVMALILAMFIMDPIKIILFGPVVHHMQAILKHKRAVGFLGVLITVIALAHDIKETFCPSSL